MFVITQILHLSLRTDHGLFPSRHSQILLFYPHENLCQPSSLQAKLRSIRTRLNWLQTVIDGQKSQRSPTDLDWTRAFAHDGRDPRSCPQTKLCRKKACTAELQCKPTRRVDQLCEMCPASSLHSSSHCSNDVSVDSVIGFSVGGCRGRGTEAWKEDH